MWEGGATPDSSVSGGYWQRTQLPEDQSSGTSLAIGDTPESTMRSRSGVEETLSAHVCGDWHAYCGCHWSPLPLQAPIETADADASFPRFRRQDLPMSALTNSRECRHGLGHCPTIVPGRIALWQAPITRESSARHRSPGVTRDPDASEGVPLELSVGPPNAPTGSPSNARLLPGQSPRVFVASVGPQEVGVDLAIPPLGRHERDPSAAEPLLLEAAGSPPRSALVGVGEWRGCT
jgi:hypothetical protein